MNLKERLLQDLRTYMKNKETLEKDTVTMLRAAILQVEKDEVKTLTEQEIHGIVAKEIKKRKESIVDFEKGKRPDIVENIKKEMEVLSKYLPEQLTKEEIETLIDKAIESTKAQGIRDMGKIMNSIKDKTIGKADGKQVSDIVREKLLSFKIKEV